MNNVSKKLSNKDFHWNVYREDFNAKKIETIDIFNEGSITFSRGFNALLKSCDAISKDEFAERLRQELLYAYWSKSEWEVVITSLLPHIDAEDFEKTLKRREEFLQKNGHYPYIIEADLRISAKIDVYDQVRLNWEQFVNYCWNKIQAV